MKWRRIILVILPLVLGLMIWAFLGSGEPTYQGKALGDWARQYGTNNWTRNKEQAREAEAAILQIGPKGIPFLLERLRAHERPLQRISRKYLPSRWHGHLGLIDKSGDVRRSGAWGLAALGTNASGAVPEIVQIGRTHSEEDGRYIAVFALRNLKAEAAIPFYVECLTNEQAIIREEAVVGLGVMKHRPKTVIPILVEFLESAKAASDTWEHRSAINILGFHYGTNAIAAVPVMVELLQGEDVKLRDAIKENLPRIDPVTAARVLGFAGQE